MLRRVHVRRGQESQLFPSSSATESLCEQVLRSYLLVGRAVLEAHTCQCKVINHLLGQVGPLVLPCNQATGMAIQLERMLATVKVVNNYIQTIQSEAR